MAGRTALIQTYLTNVVMSPDVSEYVEGSDLTLTLTIQSGYEWQGVPSISTNAYSGAFDNSYFTKVDEKTYEYVLPKADFADYVPNPQFVVSADAILTGKVAQIQTYLTNVVMSPDVSEYVEGSDLTLTLTIQSGYEWQGVPSISTNAYSGAFDNSYFTKVDEKTYEYVLPKADFADYVTYPQFIVNADALPVTVAGGKYGVVTLYKPTSQNLTDLAKMRFQDIAGGDVLDLAQYITSLKSIPLDVETSLSGDIILGKTDTDITAPIVDNDEITLELGEVALIGLYGNALDADNMTIEVVLPYIGILDIDSAKCANKTISVKYRVNLISGDCMAMVYLKGENSDVLLTTGTGTIGFDVPYILKSETAQVIQNASGDVLFNDSPCVNVFQKPKVLDNVPAYGTKFVEYVGSLSGYNKASRIVGVNNMGVIMNDEMKEIERMLTSGIVVSSDVT